MDKLIKPEDVINGEKICLRLVILEDCKDKYLKWLLDDEVNKYLETRWSNQSLEAIESFVGQMLGSTENYLFAIIEKSTEKHIGNIKIGPININHSFADVSYFIGDKAAWGKGYATEAIKLVTCFGFEMLGLHRMQAGLYEGNIGSGKCLEKAGYKYECHMRKQLKTPNGWEDHKFYGILREEWESNKI